jgi:hypothetical protein
VYFGIYMDMVATFILLGIRPDNQDRHFEDIQTENHEIEEDMIGSQNK